MPGKMPNNSREVNLMCDIAAVSYCKRIRAAAVCLVLLLAFAQIHAETTLSSVDKIPEIKGSEGYLLMYLEAGKMLSSLSVVRCLNADFSCSIEKKVRIRGRRLFSIDLKNLKNGFYLLNLPEGAYQITEVNAPFYDLPFRMNTARDRNWRFTIEKGKANYAGRLIATKQRSDSAVNIKLVNRIATDFDEINNILSDFLLTTPLTMGVGVKDDFLSEL